MKKTIKLTEGELKQVIENSVNRIIRESEGNFLDDVQELLEQSRELISDYVNNSRSPRTVMLDLAPALNCLDNALNIIGANNKSF